MESRKAIIWAGFGYLSLWFGMSLMVIVLVPWIWVQVIFFAVWGTIMSIEKRTNIGEKYR